jgi:hypothetical protein
MADETEEMESTFDNEDAEEKPKKLSNDELDKLMSKARRSLKRAVDWDDHNVQKGIANLKFVYVEGEQWTEGDKTQRKGRPTLESNMLIQYIEQLVGEERQSRPWIKCVPKSIDATTQAAETRQGHINDILYNSNAEAIFDYAQEMMAAGNRGAWRVCTRYTEENPFVQEIYLERITNPYVVKVVPCKSEVYADATEMFVIEKMPVDDYKDKYGESFFDGYAAMINSGKGMGMEAWYDKETVTIAEWFRKVKSEKTFCLMDDGEILEEDIAKEKVAKYKKAAKSDSKIKVPEIKKTRTVDTFKIKRSIINGLQVLEEEKTFPGEYIPIVIANGKDINIEGKTYIRSLTEKAHGDQKMKNFWKSHLAELIKIQPKTPWVATAKQIAGYETLYKEANDTNLTVLPYNVDPDTPSTKPSREVPGAPPNAIFQQIGMCDEDIRACIGMGRSSTGSVDKVYSGAALSAMAKPGDIVAFGYIDNLRRAVLHTAKIINSMFPEVMDTARDLSQRMPDESRNFEPVNTTLGEAVAKFKADPQRFSHIDTNKKKQLTRMMNDPKKGPNHPYNDLTKGKFETQMVIGPQFSTQRSESAAKLLELARHWPQLLQFGGDVLLRSQDFVGGEELAERMKRTIPPHIAPPKEGEPQRMPPQPTPQVMLAQAKLMTEKVKTMHEEIKLKNDMKDDQKNIEQTVLKLLEQVFAEQHPADATLPPQQLPAEQ